MPPGPHIAKALAEAHGSDDAPPAVDAMVKEIHGRTLRSFFHYRSDALILAKVDKNWD